MRTSPVSWGKHSRLSASAVPGRGITLAGVGLMVLLLTGCGTLQRGVDMARGAVFGPKGVRPAPEEVAASPYAQLLIEDDAVSAVMLLGNDDDGRTAWFTDQHVLFLCEGDLVCGTHGLSARLDDMRIVGPNPFVDLRAIGQAPSTVDRRYDWHDGYRYGVQVTGTVRRVGEEEVEILERKRTLVRYEEQLSGGVDGKNIYWIDPATGQLRKSRQLVAPGHYAEIEILKPYRRRVQ